MPVLFLAGILKLVLIRETAFKLHNTVTEGYFSSLCIGSTTSSPPLTTALGNGANTYCKKLNKTLMTMSKAVRKSGQYEWAVRIGRSTPRTDSNWQGRDQKTPRLNDDTSVVTSLKIS
ncbi:hypothetical protein chiPu_0010181 [Chiloscyllium punctatum]|uniref:Uncharacterized protein n=1 Tax=Chiloscyllium punctatum TaxID=137246 RepID=A0A401SMW0_CHIPU|nr:hypothetical protein [Chiloscyllium punctatum]